MNPRRLIVVSNRLPVTFEEDPCGWKAQPSSGGLVTALRPILEEQGGYWVGWTGTDYDPRITTLLAHPSASSRPYSLVPVFLTPAETASFYRGCSNAIIWPLFHDLPSQCRFEPEFWTAYGQVNEKFADSVAEVARSRDFIWVHDYHLMLVAAALRARGSSLPLSYFHHIPFPPPDVFEKLPWRNQILRALLQFDSVGFQTDRDRRNFVACVRRCLSHVHVHRMGEKLQLQAEGRCTTVGIHPISIPYEQIAADAAAPGVTAAAEVIQQDLAPTRIVLGVDRLDYTKGITQRLLAFQALLAGHAELRGKVTLVQIVVPSREDIPEYRQLKLSVERLVSEINGEYGTPAWVPIRYLHRCISPPELLAFYRAAQVALVTPLKDGMNLVAKEFCAARVDDRGVLVLSEFAGAARELSAGAVLVNPYDREAVASAIGRAIQMEEGEQQARMQAMRAHLRAHDVFDWGRSVGATGAPFAAAARATAATLGWPAEATMARTFVAGENGAALCDLPG